MKFQLVLAVILLLLLQKKLVAKSDSNFIIQVVLHSWHNPSNTLADGRACCAPQTDDELGMPCCNSRFIFYSSCDIKNITTRINATGKYENEESGNITFGTLNRAKPFVYYSKGELAVVVRDVDRDGPNSVIDDICITIPTVLVNLTDPVILTGSQDHALVLSYNVTCAQGYCGPNCSAHNSSSSDEQDLPYTPMGSANSSESPSIIGGVIGCSAVIVITLGVLVTYIVLRRRKRGTTSGEEYTDSNCHFSPGDNHLYSGAMGSHTTEIPKQKHVSDTKFGTLSCHEYECTDFVVNKSNMDCTTDGIYEAAYAAIGSLAEHEEQSLPPQSEHYCFQFGGGGAPHAPQIYGSDECVAFPDPESDSESDGVYEVEHPTSKQHDDLGDYPTLIRTESALNGLLMEQNSA